VKKGHLVVENHGKLEYMSRTWKKNDLHNDLQGLHKLKKLKNGSQIALLSTQQSANFI
jgi:hypothetical protein